MKPDTDDNPCVIVIFLFFQTPQNGAQVKTGSCNPTPMGDLVPFANLPASKFTNPKNMDTIAANQAFTITMAVKNIQMGNFVNPATNYYSAPQQIQNGQVVGHSHFVIEKIDSLTSTQVTDPTTFAFFKVRHFNPISPVVVSPFCASFLIPFHQTPLRRPGCQHSRTERCRQRAGHGRSTRRCLQASIHQRRRQPSTHPRQRGSAR